MKPSAPLSEPNNTSNNGNYFQYEFDKDYQRIEVQYFDFVDQHDLQGIMVGSRRSIPHRRLPLLRTFFVNILIMSMLSFISVMSVECKTTRRRPLI